MTRLYVHQHSGVVYAEDQVNIIKNFVVALCQMDLISEYAARSCNAYFIELTFD